MAYDRLEPIGIQHDRLQIATLLAMTAAPKDGRRFTPDDFMPGEASRRAAPSESDVVAKGRAMFGSIAAGQQARAAKRKKVSD